MAKKQQWRPTCVFCRRQSGDVTELGEVVTMSDEHVFLESLKHLATPGVTARIRTVYVDPQSGELCDTVWEDRNKNAYQLTVRICAICNTDVLNNKIEVPIGEKLRAMIEGRLVALDSESMLQLATWSAKTAMTRELLDKGKGTPAIPPEQYTWLHDHLLPPPTMMMFFGKTECTPDTWHRHRQFHMPDSSARGHFTTLVIGHLWIVVAGFSNREFYEEVGPDVHGHCLVGNQGVLVKFWPPLEHEIDWDANAFKLDPREFPPGHKNGAIQGSRDDYLRVSWGPPRIGWDSEELTEPDDGQTDAGDFTS